MYIAIFVVMFITCAIVCHNVAKGRGGNPVFWGVMGAVFGPLAVPFVFMVKPSGK